MLRSHTESVPESPYYLRISAPLTQALVEFADSNTEEIEENGDAGDQRNRAANNARDLVPSC